MSSRTADYLDGNAAAGDLSKIFGVDVTAAQGQPCELRCNKAICRAHLYMQAPGVVARCVVCEHVLLRLVNARQRVFLTCAA